VPRSPIDHGITDLALSPYHTNCRYLKKAFADIRHDDHAQSPIDLFGEFAIDESCYIASTGHFNAVEANICVNQISYAAFAWFVSLDIEHPYRAAIGAYSLGVFHQKQLPNMYIVSLSTSFRRRIDPRNFQCRAQWTSAKRKRSIGLLTLTFEFTDHSNGLAQGNVLFALT
jgi:hypothetical protein